MKENYTALILAAKVGDVTVVKLLCDKKADLDAENRVGGDFSQFNGYCSDV